MNISLTGDERASCKLGDTSLADAVEAIREDGYVVIEQAVDHAHLDVLKERMTLLCSRISWLIRMPSRSRRRCWATGFTVHFTTEIRIRRGVYSSPSTGTGSTSGANRKCPTRSSKLL